MLLTSSAPRRDLGHRSVSPNQAVRRWDWCLETPGLPVWSRSHASSVPALHRAGMVNVSPAWSRQGLSGLFICQLLFQSFGCHLLRKTTDKRCSEPRWHCQPWERGRGHEGGKGMTGETSALVYGSPCQITDDNAFSFGNRVRTTKYLQICINKPR